MTDNADVPRGWSVLKNKPSGCLDFPDNRQAFIRKQRIYAFFATPFLREKGVFILKGAWRKRKIV